MTLIIAHIVVEKKKLAGTDLILPQLVEKGMKAAGLPTKIKTGSLVF